MNLTRSFFLRASIIVLLAELSFSAALISGYALQAYGFTGRNLLQETQNDCPIRFEFMNYTIITSKCKGPQYKADLCCSSFKEFACPYRDLLNDGTNNCATVMFSYINGMGRYPPGLFAYECRDGKDGLDCTAYSSRAENSTSSTSSSSANNNGGLFSLVSVGTVFLGAVFLLWS